MEKKYIRTAIRVEAIQHDIDNIEEIEKFIGEDFETIEENEGSYAVSSYCLVTDYLGNSHILNYGDYVVKDSAGKIFMCTKEGFEENYKMYI